MALNSKAKQSLATCMACWLLCLYKHWAALGIHALAQHSAWMSLHDLKSAMTLLCAGITRKSWAAVLQETLLNGGNPISVADPDLASWKPSPVAYAAHQKSEIERCLSTPILHHGTKQPLGSILSMNANLPDGEVFNPKPTQPSLSLRDDG